MDAIGAEPDQFTDPADLPDIRALRIDMLTHGEAIDPLVWDRLALCASTPNPFYESWYLRPSLTHLAGGEDVRLWTLWDGRRLVAMLPLARSLLYASYPLPHWHSWLHPNMFDGTPLVAKGYEVEFWRMLLGWLDEHCGHALFFHLHTLPVDSPLYRALESVTAQQSRACRVVQRHERAMLSSTLEPAAYWDSSVPKRRRKEIARQGRRLSELGTLRVDRQHGLDGIDPWVENFLTLEAAGWKGERGSPMQSDPATAALFRKSMEGAAMRGRLERLALLLDDKPVAMLATFLTPPASFSYKTTYDEAFARYSPGVLLQRENIALLDNPEIEWCDSCATADHTMIDHLWRERRTIVRVSIAIGGRLRRAIFERALAVELARKGASA